MTQAQPSESSALAIRPDMATSMMGELLSIDDILLELDAANKMHAFEVIAGHLQRKHGIDSMQVCACLAEREKLGSTGLGRGVAIPHARLRGLRHAIAVFARLSMPMNFDAPDNKPVSDMLVLLVPQHADNIHLKILADVAAMFCERDFRGALSAATDAATVQELFATWRRS